MSCLKLVFTALCYLVRLTSTSCEALPIENVNQGESNRTFSILFYCISSQIFDLVLFSIPDFFISKYGNAGIEHLGR